MDVATARRAGAEILRRAGIEQPYRDSELLLAHLLGWNLARLLAHTEKGLSKAEQGRFFRLIKLRSGRYPLQYIVGSQEFWGRRFDLTPAVLIPRPETELIIERVLNEKRRLAAIADIGTGSGCLAVTLAAELAGIQVVASDVSQMALDVAAHNAYSHGVSRRVRFLRGVWLEPFRLVDPPLRFDWIVSNPPYGSPHERRSLQPEVLFEPPASVFAEGAEENSYEALARSAPSFLEEDGRLAVEIGFGSHGRVTEVFERNGWRVEQILPDLAGIARCLVAHL